MQTGYNVIGFHLVDNNNKRKETTASRKQTKQKKQQRSLTFCSEIIESDATISDFKSGDPLILIFEKGDIFVSRLNCLSRNKEVALFLCLL